MFSLFKRAKILREKGVLGINRRIGRYILPNNPRRFFPYVDDKVLTSKRAEEFNVPMPKNYMVIESLVQTNNLREKLGKFNSFVIKPACGAMGNGITLITKIEHHEDGAHFYNTKGIEVDFETIQHHISGILSGLYSLSGRNDKAIIQELIYSHEVFDDYSYKGIPDIRVIVFKGFPVLAMTRLPTKESDGKANLHQGACGCGLEISSGRVNSAVRHNRSISHHPDTGADFKDLQVVEWEKILEMASRCKEMTGLGYVGADIVLDRKRGPILLEVNARPGLSIQIANMSGLNKRLEYIESLEETDLTPAERVKHSMRFF